ncbi:MAG: hypothetical protein LC708_00765, partial [Actinobacteria bacterium]|nr:hypothetical protein [Actinomycetota bacterium]
PSFTPVVAGTYRFVATYSGDVNNLPAGPTACNDPAEAVLVRPNPTLTTTASPSVPEGGAISDTATLSGGITPTGTITFNLYGPNNATCTGTPIFTSTATVAGNGVYQSGAFTTSVNGPAGPGTYRWVATYSGDTANNAAGPTACNDPAEQVVVTNVVPAITITKTPNPGTRPEPGGTFTFTLVVTNPSNEPVTITRLVDDIYGDVNGKGGCLTGAVLAPNGGSYTCAFPGDFFGAAPATQTDTVTVTGVDNEGATVTAIARATVGLTNVPPSITVVKSASPASRPEPGGTFTFSVVVTNTSIKPVRLTDLVDDIYGNLAGKGGCAVGSILAANGGTYSCTFPGEFKGVGSQTQTDIVTATAVDNAGNRVSARDDAQVAITSVLPRCLTGAVLAPNGGSYTCAFPGDFMGLSGDTQTDTVTGTAVDSQGRQATAMARATVNLTPVPPTITVKKVADPLTKPEPGGDFTFTVTVTNTSFKQVTLTSLDDDKYGDLNGRGSCKTGPTVVLAPNGGIYTCSFTGPFTGVGGDSQTDTVTAVVVDNRGNRATAMAQATVTLTNVPPTIAVTKTPDPSSRQAPGGPFTFTVTVQNTTVYPLKLTALTDNIYGDLNGKGDCKTGGTIDPGATYTCTFTGNFSGNAGDRQTDTVTATATNSRNQSVTATAQATVSLTPGPPPPAPVPTVQVRTGALARTGLGLGGPTRLALAMVLLGALLLLASFRSSWRPALAVPDGVASAVGKARRRWAERTARRLRDRLMPSRRTLTASRRRPSQLWWRGARPHSTEKNGPVPPGEAAEVD